MVPTRDHDLIRVWAQRHNALPAEIRPRKFDGEPAILTFLIDEPDVTRPEIFPISWESFFAQFDLLGLAMAFDEDAPRFDITHVEGSQSTLSH